MNYIAPILGIISGLAIGGFAVWVYCHLKIERHVDRAKAESEAERLRLAERLQNCEQNMLELKGDVLTKGDELREEHNKLIESERQLARYKQALSSETKQHQEKLALLDEAKVKLEDAFKALASDALKSNNQSFLDLAKANLQTFQTIAQGDLEKRQIAIDQMVKPVKESLDKFDTKIQDLENARVGAYSTLKEQVDALIGSQKELRTETSNLVKALRAPTVRGRWGEIQLRRVVELAGMIDHCDFCEQQTIQTDEGPVRPDLTICLPAQKRIVVDSKAPLSAYLEAIEAADDEVRKLKLQEHARQIRSHMIALGRKAYFEQFEQTPEFVVLFLPGEVFFSEALSHDPSLIEFGVENNVIIATPTTLIALLRAVAYGWRQEQMTENARQISELGRELHKRCSDMGGHISKLGKNLQQAVKCYNEAVGSLESRVLVSARKFVDLGSASSDAEVCELVPLEITTRTLQAPELVRLANETEFPDEETTKLPTDHGEEKKVGHLKHGFTDEDIALAKRRLGSDEPRFTTQRVLEQLQSLEDE